MYYCLLVARILLNNVQYIKKLVMVSACLFMLEQIPIKLETRGGDDKLADHVAEKTVLRTTKTTEKPSKLILVSVTALLGLFSSLFWIPVLRTVC